MLIEFLHSLHGFELASITVLTGVLIATSMLRLSGTSPGGILGAAFLLLAASDSMYWALALVAIAPLISLFFGRYCSHIYAGREPIFVMAGLSIILTTIVGMTMQYFDIIPKISFSFPLGMIVPAIIASSVRKQGLARTYKSLFLAILLTLEAVVVIHAAGQWLGHDFGTIDRLADSRQTLELSWSALFALASIIIGFGMYYKFRVKAAGFIILPLLATIAVVSPANFVLLLATAAVVYLITRLMRQFSLVFGISRYALVLTLSITMVWTVTYLTLHYTRHFSPYMGTGLFAALAVSVLVNEHTIYGIPRAFPVFAVGLAAMVVMEMGGSVLAASSHHYTNSLHYYVIRQSTDVGTNDVRR